MSAKAWEAVAEESGKMADAARRNDLVALAYHYNRFKDLYSNLIKEISNVNISPPPLPPPQLPPNEFG